MTRDRLRGLRGFAALLCGKALPFRHRVKAIIVFRMRRKYGALPHSRAAQPLHAIERAQREEKLSMAAIEAV